MKKRTTVPHLLSNSNFAEGRLYPAATLKRVVPYREDYAVSQADHPFLQALIRARLHLFLMDGQWTIVYKNITLMAFFLYEGHVHIEGIFTYPQHRRKGHAGKLMQRFIAVANQTDTTLKLALTNYVGKAAFIACNPAITNRHCIDSTGEVPTKQLPDWFRKFGFRKAELYRKDNASYGYYMKRLPKR